VIPAISGAVGPLGPSEWTVPNVGGVNAPASGSGSFSGALSKAVDSLEATQADGTNAAQQLATGQLTDPTQAITAVENASLAMDLASQIRTKLVDATNQIFQTQV
jgi:flagellar hook-basal body complex protein FliE